MDPFWTPSEKDMKKFFHPGEWDTFPEFDKKRYINILENYNIMKDLDLDPEVPDFIVNWKNKQVINDSIESSTNMPLTQNVVRKVGTDKVDLPVILDEDCNAERDYLGRCGGSISLESVPPRGTSLQSPTESITTNDNDHQKERQPPLVDCNNDVKHKRKKITKSFVPPKAIKSTGVVNITQSIRSQKEDTKLETEEECISQQNVSFAKENVDYPLLIKEKNSHQKDDKLENKEEGTSQQNESFAEENVDYPLLIKEKTSQYPQKPDEKDKYDSLFTKEEISNYAIRSYFFQTMFQAYIKKLMKSSESRKIVLSTLSLSTLDCLGIRHIQEEKTEKVESITTSVSSHIDSTMAAEERLDNTEKIDTINDTPVYCDTCQRQWDEICPVGHQIMSPDLPPNLYGNFGRKIWLPLGLKVAKSAMPLCNLGVFSDSLIEVGVIWGPMRDISSLHFSQLSLRKMNCYPRRSSNSLSWMDLVNFAYSKQETNTIGFICADKLYYKTIRKIQANAEIKLSCWNENYFYSLSLGTQNHLPVVKLHLTRNQVRKNGTEDNISGADTEIMDSSLEEVFSVDCFTSKWP